MLQRLYVHNFRCLENFELKIGDLPSALLIGKNGTGKSTISAALEILQGIGRGINRIGELVEPKDFSRDRSSVPIRFEVEVSLKDSTYEYVLALELPVGFKELRVSEEALSVDGNSVYSRKEAQIRLSPGNSNRNAEFSLDWHQVALPSIQVRSETDPINVFRTWLAQTVILAPIPRLMTGESKGETLDTKWDASNFAEWFTGILARYPDAYSLVKKYLQEIMPDFDNCQNEMIGKGSKNMTVRFAKEGANLDLDFENISDGEKCFFLCAVVLAANKFYGPLFCFWDEPDNYLSLSEVGHFVMALRRAFKNDGGQFLMTSHNAEAIRKFSEENTIMLDRKSRLEPTQARRLGEVPFKGDLVNALILGDLEL